ncbi:MAG: hypothetical protein JXA52_00085, partial [Planctomycetes bacterium]|nr:hypothetical protein [Planctomycetota bacterium]
MRTTKMLIIITALAVLTLTACQADSLGLEAGVATTEITLPGMPVADPLLAKAIVLLQGDQKAALVFCDQVFVGRDVSELVRAEASKETGIPYENIALIATHTHSSRDRTYNAYRSELGNRLGEELFADFKAMIMGQISNDEFTDKLAKGLVKKVGSKKMPPQEAMDFAKNITEELQVIPANLAKEILAEAVAARTDKGIVKDFADVLVKKIRNELAIIEIQKFTAPLAKKYTNRPAEEITDD